MDMITIDGSHGEGGGQIIRSSLALSLVTGKPFRIENVRAGRRKPGLRRQHVTAARAAATVGCAQVDGAELGSSALSFTPTAVSPGDYEFSVGTAGSTTLVLQTVLPALLTASGPSTVAVEGGTHNPLAPPFDFIEKCYLPLINRMGPTVTAALVRPGFFPAGGGRIEVAIEPTDRLEGIELIERGEIIARRATALLSNLPRHIGERELREIDRKLHLPAKSLRIDEVASPGPGNVVLIEIESPHVTEVVTAYGKVGVSAEDVARKAVREAKAYIDTDVPVGEHLADQLLLPLALAGRGAFQTTVPSSHTKTHIDVIAKFLDVKVDTRQINDRVWQVEIGPQP